MFQNQLDKRIDEIGGLMETERRILFFSTGRQLGFDDSLSTWFVDYVTYIYEMTSKENLRKSAWERGAAQRLPAPPVAPVVEPVVESPPADY